MDTISSGYCTVVYSKNITIGRSRRLICTYTPSGGRSVSIRMSAPGVTFWCKDGRVVSVIRVVFYTHICDI